MQLIIGLSILILYSSLHPNMHVKRVGTKYLETSGLSTNVVVLNSSNCFAFCAYMNFQDMRTGKPTK
jgi:hypothetical protein